jgi:hypothetical protein
MERLSAIDEPRHRWEIDEHTSPTLLARADE